VSRNTRGPRGAQTYSLNVPPVAGLDWGKNFKNGVRGRAKHLGARGLVGSTFL